MSDISKCSGKQAIPEHGLTRVCIKRNECYRFTAPSNEYRQAWMMTPLQIVDGKQQCEYFWPNENKLK